MNKKIASVFLFTASLFFTGCSDYLDAVPEKDIETFESIFEKRETADKWLTTAYAMLVTGDWGNISRDVGICGADEYVGNDYARNKRVISALYIGDGLQMSQSPYLNFWTDKGGARPYYNIRMLNTFMERIGDVYNLYPGELKLWTAEAKALKAFIYFELVKRYGPIVLVPQNLGVEIDINDMRIPRSDVESCFAAIVTLLDEAIPDLTVTAEKESKRRGHFCKESAMALKAKVLLYAASPMFNGNEFYANFVDKEGKAYFPATYDNEKWKRAAEAIDQTITLCEQQGYGLISGSTEKSTVLLNHMRDIELSVFAPNFESKESVFMIKGVSHGNWLATLLRLANSNDAHWNSSVLGALYANEKMVELYYTENGLPIEYDKTWNYAGRYQMGRENGTPYKDVIALGEDVLELHLKREPRFYAHIAGDGLYWQRGTGSSDKLLIRTCKNDRFGIQDARINSNLGQNITGYWVKKFIHSNFDTKNYLTGINTLGENGYPIIRMAELYMMQAEAWNEYSGPSSKVYAAINKVRSRAGVPDVQTAWSTYSKNPTMYTTQAGMREIIQREYTLEFAFEGHRFWDLRRWKKAHIELNSKPRGWKVLGETPREFFNNFTGPEVVWNRAEFRSPRDYLFPIQSEEAMISGYVQNPGW